MRMEAELRTRREEVIKKRRAAHEQQIEDTRGLAPEMIKEMHCKFEK